MSVTYRFSHPERHSSPSTCAFSPGSSLFATAVEDHIIVRFAEDLQHATHFACIPDANGPPDTTEEVQIKQLSWRSDSKYLLACAPQLGLVWVFAIADASREPKAVIRAGIEGFLGCEWSGTGTEVLCFSDNGLRITIYSLITGEMSYIQGFKSAAGCHAYSPDKQYFALVERHHNREHLCVYDAGDRYNLVRSFPLRTTDTQGISWSPCGRWLAVWENRIEYALYIYSPLGPLLGTFNANSSSFTGPDPGLGVRSISWGPGGNWIAVGGWDQKLRIIEADGWRCISTIDPAHRSPSLSTSVWREPPDWMNQSRGTGSVAFLSAPIFHTWPRRKTNINKSNPGIGISQIEWNTDGTCFALRSETIPTVVQIYSFLSDSKLDSKTSLPPSVNFMAAIVFERPVRQMKWNPQRSRRLAICTLADDVRSSNGSSGIYFWDGEWEEEDSFAEADVAKQGVVEALHVPKPFNTCDIRWSPDGNALSIIDKDQVCVLHDMDNTQEVTTPSTELSLIQE